MNKHVSGLPIEQMKKDASKIYDEFKQRIDKGESVDALPSDVACHCLALIDYVEKELLPSRTLTCVYCGQEYPQGTPTWGSKVLTDHIKVCKKHPLHKAEQIIIELKEKLVCADAEFDELMEKYEKLISETRFTVIYSEDTEVRIGRIEKRPDETVLAMLEREELDKTCRFLFHGWPIMQGEE